MRHRLMSRAKSRSFSTPREFRRDSRFAGRCCTSYTTADTSKAFPCDGAANLAANVCSAWVRSVHFCAIKWRAGSEHERSRPTWKRERRVARRADPKVCYDRLLPSAPQCNSPLRPMRPLRRQPQHGWSRRASADRAIVVLPLRRREALRSMSDANAEAKRQVPLPALLHRLGLGEHAKKSARCPFHDDKHNSFSVWKNGVGLWYWKCHAGCGEGDEMNFAEKHHGISNKEAMKLFLEMAGVNGAAPPARKATWTSQSTSPLDWQACVEA